MAKCSTALNDELQKQKTKTEKRQLKLLNSIFLQNYTRSRNL